MSTKLIGAVLILVACGGFGFSLAAAYRKEEMNLRQLVAALDYMQCELQYRLTPLPELCYLAGKEYRGTVGAFLMNLAQSLESRQWPDVGFCVSEAFSQTTGLSKRMVNAIELLEPSLGRFDLEGQLAGLEAVRQYCRKELDNMADNRDSRLRSYQTLGLCAGAAVAILFV